MAALGDSLYQGVLRLPKTKLSPTSFQYMLIRHMSFGKKKGFFSNLFSFLQKKRRSDFEWK
jgi:hypothetical protein